MTTVQVGTYVSGVMQDSALRLQHRGQSRPVVREDRPAAVSDRSSIRKPPRSARRVRSSRRIKADLAFAKVIYERDVDLLKRTSCLRKPSMRAQQCWRPGAAQVALDESTIAQRVASLNAAKVNLDYTNIISPVDGTVVSRNVTQGQTVAASFQTPTLFLIATDLTQMQVDTNVSESDIGNVAVGNKRAFTVEAYPDRTFTGTVTQVRQAPQSVQNVITYDAVVGVPNPQVAAEARNDRGRSDRSRPSTRTCCACRIRHCGSRRTIGRQRISGTDRAARARRASAEARRSPRCGGSTTAQPGARAGRNRARRRCVHRDTWRPARRGRRDPRRNARRRQRHRSSGDGQCTAPVAVLTSRPGR